MNTDYEKQFRLAEARLLRELEADANRISIWQTIKSWLCK